jgi:protein TonB
MPESFVKTLERLHPIRFADSSRALEKIKDVRPRYPDDALAAKIQGEITLEAIVDPEGRVADARVVDGVPELNEAALSAVKQWEFTPTRLNGVPTAVIFRCTVTFNAR